MRTRHQSNSLKRGILGFINAISGALILSLLLSGQAMAQVGSCSSGLQVVYDGGGIPNGAGDELWFVGEDITVIAQFVASTTNANSDNVIIPDFGYAMDCQDVPGLTYQNCVAKGHTIEFLHAVQTTAGCVNENGAPIDFPNPQSNKIDFIPTNGPLAIAEGTPCRVSWDFKVVETVQGDNEVVQVVTFPLDPQLDPAYCDINEIPTSQSQDAQITAETCDVEVKKQISVDGQNWFDADEQGDALDLGASGQAFYRVLVKNTGTVPFTGPVSVVDTTLGIDTQTIATLAPGESETLGGNIEDQNWAETCATTDDLFNTVEATAYCRTTDDYAADFFVERSDDAWGDCGNIIIDQPAISVEKTTNGEDADTPALAPNIRVGAQVTWEYTVTNNGNVTLYDLSVSDDQLGLICTAGSLAPQASFQCTTSGTATEGLYSNLATVTSNTVDGGGGQTIDDTDPSHYYGSTPSISILKEISVDGGQNWEDANDVNNQVTALLGTGALYRLTVKNTGDIDIDNVVVNDPDLPTPIVNYAVGTLTPGQTVVLTSGEISELSVPGACDQRGTFTNNSTASGDPVDGGAAVNDSDAAVLRCIGEPSVKITKSISLTGGDPWYDVENDTPAAYPADAYYRIVVENNGTAPLTDVNVKDLDPDINLDVTIASLGVGESVTLLSGSCGADPDCQVQSELYVADRCEGPGDVGNLASVSAKSPDLPDPVNDTVNDSDTANLACAGEPAIEVVKQISFDNSTWKDADTVGDAIEAPFPASVYYKIIVRNLGNVALLDVYVDDSSLGITGYYIAQIPVGGEVTLLYTGCGADPTCFELNQLFVDPRCEGPGPFGNVVSAEGEDVTQTVYSDTDEAWLVCRSLPEIKIVKEIGICMIKEDACKDDGDDDDDCSDDDGGDSISWLMSGHTGKIRLLEDDDDDSGWVSDAECMVRVPCGDDDDDSDDSDAISWLLSGRTEKFRLLEDDDDDSGSCYQPGVIVWFQNETPQVPPPQDAWYRLTVSNVGPTDLENVEVDDGSLGIVDYLIGSLLIAQQVVLDETDIPQLYQPDRCTISGDYVNTAEATGNAVGEPGDTTTDSDDATLRCNSDDICQYGDPTGLYVIYDANSDTSHGQGGAASIVPPDALFPPGPVDIVVTDQNGWEVGGSPYLGVNPGGGFWVSGPGVANAFSLTFEIYAAGQGGDDDDDSGCGDDDDLKYGSDELYGIKAGEFKDLDLVEDDDSGGSCGPIQTITFQVDCDVPLNIGDEFGAITIADFE